MRTEHGKREFWGVFVSSIALMGLLTGTALAANPDAGITSTGQNLQVEIDLDPASSTAIWAGTTVEVTARATLDGESAANVVYVLDVSGSMEDPILNPYQDIVGPDGVGIEDDCNGDGVEGSALDAACFGLIALNQSLGSDSQIDIGMVAFADGAKTADMSPQPAVQPFTSPPDADEDVSGGADVEQVIRSTDTESSVAANAGIGLFTTDITPGFGQATNYDAALDAMNTLLATQPTDQNNRAVFISDGLPIVFTSGPGSPLEAVADTTTVDTFAIGAFASGACSAGQPLVEIATATGGTCTEVSDPSTLASLLPVQSTTIVSLELKLDGTGIGSTSGTQPAEMTLADVDITDLLEPGINGITATAIAADGTEVTADVTVEVVDLLVTPPHEVHDLSTDNMHSVTATLLGSDYIVAGQTVTFEVTGQNPNGPDNETTNAGGSAAYTYTVPVEFESLGLDMITATATIDGVSRSKTVTAEWIDATPPEAACRETYNPTGKNVPRAPGNGGQAQNPDGFYELFGVDEPFGAAGVQMYLIDDGSGTIFGPFDVGTRVKYTQANGTTPRMKAMAGNNGAGGKATAVDYHIWGNGDGALLAVDVSGNESQAVSCLVPRPPK